MRFSPVSHRSRSQSSREFGTAARPVIFRKYPRLSRSPWRHLLGSGWTMVTYVPTYKSRIVRSPMFSRPHINPGGERPCTPVLFNSWPLLWQCDPWLLIYQVTSVRSHAAKSRGFVDYPARERARPNHENAIGEPNVVLVALFVLANINFRAGHWDRNWPSKLRQILHHEISMIEISILSSCLASSFLSFSAIVELAEFRWFR